MIIKLCLPFFFPSLSFSLWLLLLFVCFYSSIYTHSHNVFIVPFTNHFCRKDKHLSFCCFMPQFLYCLCWRCCCCYCWQNIEHWTKFQLKQRTNSIKCFIKTFQWFILHWYRQKHHDLSREGRIYSCHATQTWKRNWWKKKKSGDVIFLLFITNTKSMYWNIVWIYSYCMISTQSFLFLLTFTLSIQEECKGLELLSLLKFFFFWIRILFHSNIIKKDLKNQLNAYAPDSNLCFCV